MASRTNKIRRVKIGLLIGLFLWVMTLCISFTAIVSVRDILVAGSDFWVVIKKDEAGDNNQVLWLKEPVVIQLDPSSPWQICKSMSGSTTSVAWLRVSFVHCSK